MRPARDHSAPGSPDLGLVSLPVLCCLLGAALYVYEYGGREPTLTREFSELEDRVARSRLHAEDLATQNLHLERQVRLLTEAAQLHRARREASDLRRQAEELDALGLALERFAIAIEKTEGDRVELRRLEAERDRRISDTSGLFGGYRGRYVLIECVDEAVIVHPGARRIALVDLLTSPDALLREIQQTGYVALAARPAGWHERSFNPVKRLIQERLTASAVARTDFPLTADEPLTPYLPPGD